MEEVLPESFYERKADGLVSTNAIHLYYQLPETLRSWKEALKPGARVHIQSGNIRNPDADPDVWIIDETVEAIHRTAMEMVRTQPEYGALRPLLDDKEYMNAHDSLRKKYFLPVRPRSFYTETLTAAGLKRWTPHILILMLVSTSGMSFWSCTTKGFWAGSGAAKITKKPTESGYRTRKDLMWKAMQTLIQRREKLFQTVWTYMNFRNGA